MSVLALSFVLGLWRIINFRLSLKAVLFLVFYVANRRTEAVLVRMGEIACISRTAMN